MVPEDMTKTTFTTKWKTYCYTVMSFGLKNARETYQKMVTALLHDIIVKSRDREGQIVNLRKVFERIKEYKFKLNPQKCTFGVTAG